MVVLYDGKGLLTRRVDAQSRMSVGNIDDAIIELPQRVGDNWLAGKVEVVVNCLVGFAVLRHYTGTCACNDRR